MNVIGILKIPDESLEKGRNVLSISEFYISSIPSSVAWNYLVRLTLKTCQKYIIWKLKTKTRFKYLRLIAKDIERFHI